MFPKTVRQSLRGTFMIVENLLRTLYKLGNFKIYRSLGGVECLARLGGDVVQHTALYTA